MVVGHSTDVILIAEFSVHTASWRKTKHVEGFDRISIFPVIFEQIQDIKKIHINLKSAVVKAR